MENVVVFPGAKPPPAPEPLDPHCDTLRLAEDLLESVKAGKVVAVAIVAVESDGKTSTSWSNHLGMFHHMVSGAAHLLARMTR